MTCRPDDLLVHPGRIRDGGLGPGRPTRFANEVMRGDIIKTMHRATANGRDRAAGDFAIEGTPASPTLGRRSSRTGTKVKQL